MVKYNNTSCAYMTLPLLHHTSSSLSWARTESPGHIRAIVAWDIDTNQLFILLHALPFPCLRDKNGSIDRIALLQTRRTLPHEEREPHTVTSALWGLPVIQKLFA